MATVKVGLGGPLRSAAGGPGEASLATIPLFELDHSTAYDHLTTLYVPPAGPQASFNRLQEIVAHLRAPDGCPWDREQTVQTLRKDLLEEIYELVEALDEDDDCDRCPAALLGVPQEKNS